MTTTRRAVLERIGLTLGLGAMTQAAGALGLVSEAEARVTPGGTLPPDTGAGRSVAVLGAGVSGLRAAWELAAAGFDVTVLEATDRMGGRSLTLRPSDEKYKAWWLEKQKGRFPESAYNTRVDEVGKPVQTCEFQDDAWAAGEVEEPDELYLNAGPGRIPSFHDAVLDHCRKFNVQLEPFTFTSRKNLMQSDKFNDGEPTELGLVKHSLRIHIVELLNEIPDYKLKKDLTNSDIAALKKLFVDFEGRTEHHGQPVFERLGYDYARTPGAWFNGGQLRQEFSLTDILDGEAWTQGLFNDMRVYWQTSLMQPSGGMDRLWVDVLSTPLPEAVGGGTIEGLVQISSPVTRIINQETGAEVHWTTPEGGEQSATFDFVVSTMGPKRLAAVVEGFDETFTEALHEVPYMPAAKVGWQSRGRWFEDDYEIYGGISWINHEITQTWYPSQDFHSRNATLTGLYNSGERAKCFGRLPFETRLEVAAEGGAKLHNRHRSDPERFPDLTIEKFKEDYVYYDRGVSVAWHYMPYQDGGWVDHAFETGEKTKRGSNMSLWDIVAPQPHGHALYLAGDWISHTPGWMEGALRTALASVYAIADLCQPRQSSEDPDAPGSCRYEYLVTPN